MKSLADPNIYTFADRSEFNLPSRTYNNIVLKILDQGQYDKDEKHNQDNQ